MKNYLSIFLCCILTSLFWLGCASENPNLVNPPSGLDSIYVRLVNFANDNQLRVLTLAGVVQTSPVPTLASSSTISSPSDSSQLTISINGNEEYRPQSRLRFSRTSFQSIVALPSGSTSPIKRPLDTLIALYTPYHNDSNPLNATIRMMNCISDNAAKFSLRLGCANGAEIAFDNGYRSQSSSQEIPAGKVGVTLVKRIKDSVQVLDLFQCTLNAGGAYSFFVIQSGSTAPTLYVLNERDNTSSSLTALQSIPERTASLRTVNLSTSTFDIERVRNQTFQSVINKVSSGQVTDYVQITACESLSADTFRVTPTSSSIFSIATTTIEALKRYTLLTFDNSSPEAAMIIPQFTTATIPAGNSVMRVVNALPLQTSITVSLGAHTDVSQASSGFSSGTILANRLGNGAFSEQVTITSGELPITVFTSGSPAQLLFSTVAQLDPQKKYLYVLWQENEKIKSALIEENQSTGLAEILPHGAFAEIVHAQSGQEKIICGFDKVINSATLFYGNSLSTVLPSGNRTLNANGISFPITTFEDSTLLALITGSTSNDIMLFSSPAGRVKLGQSVQRFINACKEVPSVYVTRDSLNGIPIFSRSITYRTSADTLINYERRTTLVFSDPFTKKEYYRVENVSLPLGKNYSIIFIGSGGIYNAIIQQEF